MVKSNQGIELLSIRVSQRLLGIEDIQQPESSQLIPLPYGVEDRLRSRDNGCLQDRQRVIGAI